MAKRTPAWAALAGALIAATVCATSAGGAQGGGWGAADQGGEIAEELTLRTSRTHDGKSVRVGLALVLQISRDVVWAVLNDHENMPRFVPDVLATRLISTGAGRKRVEIEGVARFLLLDIPVSTTLDVVYHPDGSVGLDSVAGNLAIHGVVRVDGGGSYTRVDYQVRMTPDFWLPPVIGDFLIGRQIRRQFEGMVAEMRRRAGRQRM